MDAISGHLEDMATSSIALSRAISDNIEDDIDKGLLLTEANTIDHYIHVIRQHLEEMNTRTNPNR